MTRVHFDITHPAHVHLFRHAIRELVDDGHAVAVSSREKEITTDLLDAYDIEHTVLSRKGTRKPGLVAEWLGREVRALRYAWQFDPDVVVSRLSPTAIHAGATVGAGNVVFNDHEGADRLARLCLPLVDRICTPDSFETDYGEPHRRHAGVQELAYLHPDRFEPDFDQLRDHGVDPDDPFAVLRFVSMGAYHDVGRDELSPEVKRRLVDSLSDLGEVYVSTEGPLPPDLDARPVPVPPAAIHDLLAAANVLVTDSNTMATEAGLLGTPSVRSGSYVDTGELSNFAALADAGLVESIADGDAAVERAVELAADPDASDRWAERRQEYVAASTDVTEYIVDTVLEVAEERDAK